MVPIEIVADGTQIIGNIMNKSDGIVINGNNNTVAQNSFMPSLRNSFIGCTGSYNTIESNDMAGSSGGGVNVWGPSNVIYNNAIGGEDSIEIHGNTNVIAKNNITRSAISIDGSGNVIHANIVAMLVTSGYNNTFIANDVSEGLSIYKNEDNTADHTFYYNNFVRDPEPFITFSDWTQGTVFFDNGREGNYWRDYAGKDADGDGIGDTPYVVGFSRKDNYPLMAPIKSFDAGTWEGTNYNVNVISNSTVSNFRFNPEEGAQIRFNAEGKIETTGFCRVTIPKNLLYAEGNWTVLTNGNSVTPTINEDTSNTYLYFTYQHSTKTIEIIGTTAIPEFPSWIILPLFMVVTFVTVTLYRMRLKKLV